MHEYQSGSEYCTYVNNTTVPQSLILTEFATHICLTNLVWLREHKSRLGLSFSLAFDESKIILGLISNFENILHGQLRHYLVRFPTFKCNCMVYLLVLSWALKSREMLLKKKKLSYKHFLRVYGIAPSSHNTSKGRPSETS